MGDMSRRGVDYHRQPGVLGCHQRRAGNRPGLLVLLAVLLALTSACAPTAAPARPLTYVALGASDAVGVGAADPEREGWVPRFGATLGPTTRVVNLGVSGSTLAQALREQLDPALAARPDVITVWLAVNDFTGRVSLEGYVGDLDRLLGRLTTTKARLLVGNLPDLAPIAGRTGRDPVVVGAEVERWNVAIATVVARHDARLVDLYVHWQELAQHPEYLAADGFHPSAAGYSRLAEIFTEAYARQDG
jgi:lysophospholipase L1-like esterase